MFFVLLSFHDLFLIIGLIKDIAESEVEEGGSLVLTGDLQQPDGGSGESINTIKNPSGSNTAQVVTC